MTRQLFAARSAVAGGVAAVLGLASCSASTDAPAVEAPAATGGGASGQAGAGRGGSSGSSGSGAGGAPQAKGGAGGSTHAGAGGASHGGAGQGATGGAPPAGGAGVSGGAPAGLGGGGSAHAGAGGAGAAGGAAAGAGGGSAGSLAAGGSGGVCAPLFAPLATAPAQPSPQYAPVPRRPLGLNWSARGPVGMLFLAPVDGKGAEFDGLGPANPRGWFNAHDVDITTPAGLASFQARLLAYADTSIAALLSIRAQGMITWDLEGEQYPQATTYIGDPRLVAQLAPELESKVADPQSPFNNMKVIDAYFKKFHDAGLTVGLTLRPQQLLLDTPADCQFAEDLRHSCQPFLTDDKQITDLLLAKIAYARQRWDVRIFYVDSSVYASLDWKCDPGDPGQDPATCPHPELLSGGRSRLGGSPVNSAIFATVAQANPDVLIIPEQHLDEDFSSVTPLFQLFQDFGHPGNNYKPAHTPDAARAAYPGAFSAIIINNAGLAPGDMRYQELVQGVSQGDVLLARGWYDDEPDLGTLRQIYVDAAKMQQPALLAGIGVRVLVTGPSTATVSWVTRQGASSQVSFGPTSSYGTQTPLDPALVTAHSVALTGLMPGQEYHLRVDSKDDAGLAIASGDVTFATLSTDSSCGGPLRLHAGGNASGLFGADEAYSCAGCGAYSVTAAVDTSGAVNPAPAEVYQTERAGDFRYSFGGLSAGAAYALRLHFAENDWSAAGQRVFDVSVNDAQVLEDYDIFATAGGAHRAVVETLMVSADPAGVLSLVFTGVVDAASVSAIEIAGPM